MARIHEKGSWIGSEDNCSIEIIGLSRGELDLLRAFLVGAVWLKKNVQGRVESFPCWLKPPDPIEDPEMQPFWAPHEIGGVHTQMELLPKSYANSFGASIIIESLCGYNYTPERYAQEAKRLEGFGFVQMRSQRAEDGKFFESWLLPGLWSAKGKLKNFITAYRDNDKAKKVKTNSIREDSELMKRVVEFLCRECRWGFGSLETTTQQAAMSAD